MTRDECLSVLRVLAWHSMCVFYYRATGGDRLASRRPPASRVTVFPSSSRRLFKKSRPVFCESHHLIPFAATDSVVRRGHPLIDSPI